MPSKAALMFPNREPVVSDKDGGTLGNETYGHLRREHSIAQARRVSFAPVAAKQCDVIAVPGNRVRREPRCREEKEILFF
jgi:hypothetical protein